MYIVYIYIYSCSIYNYIIYKYVYMFIYIYNDIYIVIVYLHRQRGYRCAHANEIYKRTKPDPRLSRDTYIHTYIHT